MSASGAGQIEQAGLDVTFFAGEGGDERIDRERACQLLQCGEEGLDRHIATGLPQWVEDGRQVLGFCDVMNAGLYSGSGRSVAEIAERYIARFGERRPEWWVEERRWLLTLSRSCSQGCEAGPVPGAPGEDDRTSIMRGWSYGDTADGSRGWTLEAALAGSEDQLESAPLRSLYDRILTEFRDGTIRYQYVPPGMRNDSQAARGFGVADCMTTALTLRGACEEMAVPSRLRFGYLLGIIPIEHAWLEVIDDGVYKPLDPVLALLVERSTPDDNGAQIADFCRGSTPNCLLPWPCDSTSPLLAPACEHPGADWRLTARLQRSPVSQLSATRTREGASI